MGFTVIEPLSATAVPFRAAFTAFVVPHVRVKDWPLVIEVALAPIPAATGPVGGAVTVTVAEPQSVLPVASVATIL
jgi:hypothetical protein